MLRLNGLGMTHAIRPIKISYPLSYAFHYLDEFELLKFLFLHFSAENGRRTLTESLCTIEINTHIGAHLI